LSSTFSTYFLGRSSPPLLRSHRRSKIRPRPLELETHMSGIGYFHRGALHHQIVRAPR
jgi:hypothetical protein